MEAGAMSTKDPVVGQPRPLSTAGHPQAESLSGSVAAAVIVPTALPVADEGRGLPPAPAASGKQIVDNRTRGLLACIGVMLTSGGVYLFSAYSALLAEKLDLSNTELEAIVAMGDIGQWFGIVPGMLCDRLGPRRTVMIGAVTQCLGLAMMGLAFDGWLPGHVAFLAAYNFILAQGSSMAYISAMKITQQNFLPSDRGSFVGLMASFFAMSSGAFSLTYKSVFQPYSDNLSIFFYVSAIFTLGLQYTCAQAFIVCPLQPPPALPLIESQRTRSIYIVTLSVLALQFAISLIDVKFRQESARLGTWCVYALGLLMFPALLLYVWPRQYPVPETLILCDRAYDQDMLPGITAATPDGRLADMYRLVPPASPMEEHRGLRGEGHVSSAPRAPLNAAARGVALTPPDLYAVPTDSNPRNGVAASSAGPVPTPPPGSADEVVDNTSYMAAEGSVQVEYTLRESIVMLDFWLLFVALAGGLSFSITLLNNLGGITASLSDDVVHDKEAWTDKDDRRLRYEQLVGSLVVLYSCLNVIGRLAVGIVADRYRGRITRVAWLAVGSFIALLGNLVIVLAPSIGALYVAVPLGGLAMGTIFGTAPLSTTDLFGLKQYASIWGVIVAGPCIPTALLAALAAGHFSDEGAKEHFFTMKGHRFCHGTSCYATPLVIALVVVIVATLVAGLLAKRNQESQRMRRT
jgi:MFS family permease